MTARRLALAASLSVPVLAACGTEPDAFASPAISSSTTTEQAIINGDTCDEATDPSAVALMVAANMTVFGSTQDVVQAICTGTLIAPDVVLLAAHCLETDALTGGFGTVNSAEFYVTREADLSRYAESAQTEVPASAIPVRDTVQHPDFDINAFETVNGPGDFKDVALVFLSATIDDVQPEVVISAEEASQLREGADVRIVGWGQQTVTTGGPFQPPPAGTVGIKVCGDSTLQELGDFEMQIGGDATTTRKCHGDSGGPTYMEVQTEHARTRRVVGITSHAYDQEDCNKGGVDTRVDTWLSYIDGEMSKRCDDGTRVWCDVPGIIPASFFDPAPAADDVGAGDADDATTDTGCPGGCTQNPLGGGMFVALGALLRLRRRR